MSPETVQKIRGKVVGIAIAAALGGFLFGYDTAVINGAVDALAEDFALGAALKGFAVSTALIGAALGAWFSGSIANKYGRIPVMVAAAILFFISSIGSALAFGVIDLIVWRIVGGLGVGAASVIAPAYIAEVSPARVRGRLGSLQQLAIVLGIFAALLTNAFLATLAGGANQVLWLGIDSWRWMFAAEAIPAIVYGVLSFGLPESPRYLVRKKEYDKASKVLLDFTGEPDVNLKIQQIEKSLSSEKKESLRDLAGSRFGLKPVVWVGILLSVFQQFVGINVIFYYSTTLWRSVGFDESSALFTSVISSVTNIVVTIIAILLVDKVGRKALLVAGSVIMTIALGTMAVAFSFATLVPGDGGTSTAQLEAPWSTIALIAANLFVVGFGATWGPVVWVLLGEMFPNRVRASALAVAAAAQWVANFFISTTFPIFSQFSLTFAYGFYAFFALVSLFFVIWKVPETKGIELEDMPE